MRFAFLNKKIVVFISFIGLQSVGAKPIEMDEIVRCRIGVDVGGTNTDAAIIGYDNNDEPHILSKFKATTTKDEPVQGIRKALIGAFQGLRGLGMATIESVMIGTTHLVNAIVEGKGLDKTAVIRLALPTTTSLPPLMCWETKQANAIGGQDNVFVVNGGYEYDGRVISQIDDDEIRGIPEA